MSSKSGNNGGRSSWSLAARLTAYYAISAFLIVLAATGYLYWAMVRSTDLEDDRLLADRVRLLQSIMQKRPADVGVIEQEVNEASQAQQNTQVFIRLLDARERLLVESPGMTSLLPAAAFPPPADEPGPGSNVASTAGRPMRALAVRTANGGEGAVFRVIQVAMNRDEEEEILEDYRRHLSYVLVVSVVACALVGYKIAQRGIRPIHEIAGTAGRIRSDNLAQRIATAGLPAELQQLAGTFNAMLDRLQQAFDRLSRFSADIAHELRTPLNNMRGELEVALERRRPAEEYEEIIGSSLEECGRLTRIIESLLFLARSENPQTQIEREPIDVAGELEHIREFFEPTAQDAGIRLVHDAGGPLLADLNRALFQRAVGNLIANSIAHTPRGGVIALRASADDGVLAVTIADSGAGIAGEHLPHIFDRFYRADPSRTMNGGLGLGLAIVKSVVELHGGGVAVASEPGQGTQVRMSIPRTIR